MNTTKILGEAVGVQWQGVTDQTETNTAPSLTQAIFIGRFMRGENGIMTINQNNIRGMLGHEPENPDYIAVQACLDAGVPSIKVLRVGSSGGTVNPEPPQISCAGATNSATSTYSENPNFTIAPTGFTFEVNGVQETFLQGSDGIDMNAFHAKFPNLELTGFGGEVLKNNSTTEHLRVRFQGYPPEQDGFIGLSFTDNPTGGSSDGWATVCLAPAASCVPSEPFEFTAARNQLVSHKRLTFSINGSPPSEFTGLAEPGGDDVDTNFESYFYHFGVNNRVGGNYFIISTSGGNQGAFRLGFDAESGQAIISARDDSYNPLSTTLELIATDHPDDFVTHYFGASVTLHACGTGEPA